VAATTQSPGAGGATRIRMPRRAFGWASLPGMVRRSIIVVLLLAAWQAYDVLSGISPFLLRSPVQVAAALWQDTVVNHAIPSATY